MNTTAIATVTVSVDITVGCWGADCTIGQAVKQAGETAACYVERALRESKGHNEFSNIRILSTDVKLKTWP